MSHTDPSYLGVSQDAPVSDSLIQQSVALLSSNQLLVDFLFEPAEGEWRLSEDDGMLPFYCTVPKLSFSVSFVPPHVSVLLAKDFRRVLSVSAIALHLPVFLVCRRRQRHPVQRAVCAAVCAPALRRCPHPHLPLYILGDSGSGSHTRSHSSRISPSSFLCAVELF